MINPGFTGDLVGTSILTLLKKNDGRQFALACFQPNSHEFVMLGVDGSVLSTLHRKWLPPIAVRPPSVSACALKVANMATRGIIQAFLRGGRPEFSLRHPCSTVVSTRPTNSSANRPLSRRRKPENQRTRNLLDCRSKSSDTKTLRVTGLCRSPRVANGRSTTTPSMPQTTTTTPGVLFAR